jgi:cell division protease FtsH
MADSASPDPEKSRRSRSFGSFLLVLLVLLVVLAVVGNERIGQPDELSQDQYEWHLNRGDIVTQRLQGTEQGTNLITGTYRKPGKGDARFEVSYASLDEREARFQQLKSIRRYVAIDPAVFQAGLEAGLYEPREARHLIGYVAPEEPPAPASAGGLEEKAQVRTASPPSARKDEALLVTVLARPRNELQREAEVPFPDVSGTVHFDVDLRDDADLVATLDALRAGGVAISSQSFDLSDKDRGGTRWKDSKSMFSWILLYLGPWILLLVVFMIFMRQMRSQGGAGGVMSFGRSRAQLYSKESHTNVTFDDVAGAEEAKAEVRELVEFLKNPSRFTRVGGRIPRGVLLVGPPGCGKTLLAKAIAGEAEVPFFSISGSDFVEMFVGVGASRVRDLFKQARENSPCIIFLDEIDAVGRRRGSGLGGGHDEREQTLNAILVEMDGFGTDEGIIVIAATNRPDVLDPALLRPGRFDREVTIDLPDYEGRKAILKVHLKRVKSEADADVEVLARSTPGYSGADLAAIINEAAIMAVLDKRDAVSMEDLEEARDKVRYGRQKISRKVEEEDRQITAYHEAGHAVVASVLQEIDRPHKVTIVPRGRALGATMVLPDRESYHMQRKRLLGQITMLFGGRVAESVFCGDISAGAADDIRRATEMARAMVTEYGMSERVGPINYAERQGSDFLGTELMRGKIHSEETAREIDEEVHRVLRESYLRAETMVQENRRAVEELAQALLLYETVTGKEIGRILGGERAADLRPESERVREATPKPAPEPSKERPGDHRRGELPGSPGLSPA